MAWCYWQGHMTALENQITCQLLTFQHLVLWTCQKRTTHYVAPPVVENHDGLSILSIICSLTHWGRVMHICASKVTIIGSDNGLSPGRRQAIIWTNAGILLNRTLGTNASEIISTIHTFSFKKMHLKMSSAKWCLFRLGLNELNWNSRQLFLVLKLEYSRIATS